MYKVSITHFLIKYCVMHQLISTTPTLRFGVSRFTLRACARGKEILPRVHGAKDKAILPRAHAQGVTQSVCLSVVVVVVVVTKFARSPLLGVCA